MTATAVDIAVLGYRDGVAAGSVRLFLLDQREGRWQGDRLAVLSRVSHPAGSGAPLVRCAVATAGARGGRTMMAHIQPANVPFFERLGWAAVGEPEIYAGLPHQPMCIDLPDAGAERALRDGRDGSRSRGQRAPGR